MIARVVKASVAIFVALSFLASFASTPADARGRNYKEGHPKHKPNKKPRPHVRGAPGPVVGAGLPFLAIAGAGAYWVVRRRKNQQPAES
jgi:hypothetical protein